MEYLKRFNETDYWVDIYGNVYSTKRGETKPLKQRQQGAGYYQVLLCENGKCKNHLVHRMVAHLFIESVEGKKQINHKDGDKGNNNIENLEWATGSENIKHGYKMGLIRSRKLNMELAKQIRESLLKTKTLSLIYKVSRNTILNIKKNKIWKEKQ